MSPRFFGSGGIWGRRFGRGNGSAPPSNTPRQDLLQPRRHGPEQFHIQLENLIGRERLDWYAIGQQVGTVGGDIHATRRLVRKYFDYRASLARPSFDRAKEELETPLPEETDGELRRREQVLEEEIKALRARAENLQHVRWEDPSSVVREALRENQEKHVKLLENLNSEIAADLLARARLRRQSAEDIGSIHGLFATKIAELHAELAMEKSPDHRDAIATRLDQVKTEFRKALEFNLAMDGLVREKVINDGTAEGRLHAFAADEKERVAQDALLIRRTLANLEEPVLAKGRIGLVLLGFAVIMVGAAEFAVVSKVTGDVLDIGVFVELLNRLSEDGRIRWDSIAALISVFLISLVPFGLGFWVKNLLDQGLPQMGESRWIVNLVLTISALGYILALGVRVGTFLGVTMGLVVVFLTVTLTMLNGWLLHLLLRSLDQYRRRTQDFRERQSEIDREIGKRLADLEQVREDQRIALEQRIAARRHLEREMDAMQPLREGDTAGLEAALAAVDSGYSHGLMIRAGGAQRAGAEPETEDELSALWRRLRLLRGLFPSGESDTNVGGHSGRSP